MLQRRRAGHHALAIAHEVENALEVGWVSIDKVHTLGLQKGARLNRQLGKESELVRLGFRADFSQGTTVRMRRLVCPPPA